MRMRSIATVLMMVITGFIMAEESIGIEVISENRIFIETPNWNPPMPDSVHHTEAGAMQVFLSGDLLGNCQDLMKDLWMIEFNNGNLSTECLEQENADILRFDPAPNGIQQCLLKLNAEGDTLWACVLEGTGDFDNFIQAYILSDEGFIVISQPDCWSTGTYMARISSRGELLWRTYLTSNYLLDFPEDEGEIYPKVFSVRETDQGDLLVCGSVAKWVTSSDAMFIALLDRATGDPLFKTIHFMLGEARAMDVTQTAYGMIAAVGSTAETTHPEGSANIDIWSDEEHAFILVAGSDGGIAGTAVIDDCGATGFTGVIETDPNTSEILIIGRPSYNDSVNLVLLRSMLKTEGN